MGDALDPEHCVFGEIAENSSEIVTTFNETIVDKESRPFQDIRITHTVVLDDPYEDPPGLQVPDHSPRPSKETLSATRIGADEELNDYEGLSEEQISEVIAEKEAKAQATILEMIGDLPEADCAPPENVLFVCKLNPVTNDDDLEIIFSRFGKVVSCEVIRDKKTGDSLQYAFVEFGDQKSCEQAYFKMDNVLIDDRRIHVDFSQSVSKYRWKGKGRLEVVDGGSRDKAKKQTVGGDRNKSAKGGDGRRRSPPPVRKPRSRSPDRQRRHSGERRERKRSRSREKDKRGRDSSPEKNRRRSRSRERQRSRSPEVTQRRRSRSREDRDKNRDKDRDKDRKHHHKERKRAKRSRSRERR